MKAFPRALIQKINIAIKGFVAKTFTVGDSWRMDETYIKVKGKWVYLYRAVDKEGTNWQTNNVRNFTRSHL